MSLSEKNISIIAEELYQAVVQSRVVEPLTERYPDLEIMDAYLIQKKLLEKKVQEGNSIVGKKIGVTSEAVMNMLGVDQPDFGILTDDMVFENGKNIEAETLIQPKAEGEIAFLLKHDLVGPGITSADVLEATAGVLVCIEIVDSRIRDWKIKIEDTVADNASCGVFVLGDDVIPVEEIDLVNCEMVLEKNGVVEVSGTGAATMESPLNAMVWLANTLGNFGVHLKAGEIILSGALGAMVPVMAGDHVSVSITGLGSCSMRLV